MSEQAGDDFMQIKEYQSSKFTEQRVSSVSVASRIVEHEVFEAPSNDNKVRWVWLNGRIYKANIVEDEDAEQFGNILSLVLIEDGPVSSLTGTVDFVRKTDPNSDYVLVHGKNRYAVMKNLSQTNKVDSKFKANISLKDLENRNLCQAYLRLSNPDYISESESRYYPALYIGKKEETWKGVVKMEAFSRNISIRRSDGRLITSRYTSLREVLIDEEAKPLEKDKSISSENEPVSPISEEHHHILLELACPMGGKLYVSPKLATFGELPLPSLLGLPLRLTTPLNKKEMEVFATEIASHLVIEGCGMTWGVEKLDKNNEEDSVWDKLEAVANHHESPHKQKKTPGSIEKEVLQHGPTVTYKEIGAFDYSPRSPSKSILKSSSKDRFSLEQNTTNKAHSTPPKELSSVKWKDQLDIEDSRERTSSETRVLSEKRTYFENGNIVTVIKEYSNEDTDEKRVPSDPRLSSTLLRQTVASEKKKTLPSSSSSNLLQGKAGSLMPIKKAQTLTKSRPRVSTNLKKQRPEENLMTAFDMFVNSLPSKIAPELVFPLFKEMTGRAVNLLAEYQATQKK